MLAIAINGALLSGLYALIALGFTMIYGVGRVLNLAHAGYVMVTAYIFYHAWQVMGLPMGLAMLIAIASGAGLALATYTGLVRRYLNNPTVVYVSTFILALVMNYLIVLFFHMETINVWPVVVGITKVFGYSVSKNMIAALIVSWACIIGVLMFIRRTHMGRAMRALAMDRKGAIVSGINPDTVNIMTWAISGALAGVAGIFFGSYTYLIPEMWHMPLVMSFAIVVIGGLGSIEGTIIAAHIVGYMQTTTQLVIDERLRGVFALVIMIIMLIFRPKGLFGK
ncbi:MAG: branched-chain amino acid ABC transporter permease [Dehalococcoidales bacterium]